MQFLGLLTGCRTAPTARCRPGLLEKVAKLMDELTAFGEPLAASEVAPGSQSARVTLSGGRFTVSGNTRASDMDGGESYGVFDVDSLAEAVAWTKCFLQVIGEGECELRPLGSLDDYTPAQA